MATEMRRSRSPVRTGDQCVAFRDIGWTGYVALLKVRGERSSPRINYLDGTAWLMSPALRHERLRERLGWFVLVLVEELDIPCVPTGSMTLRRRTKAGGVEPDLSYYLSSEAAVRGKARVRLGTDPPPDLAIEAVDTHGAEQAIEIYRRIGVPEVWVCDGAELSILRLEEGRYVRSEHSRAVPSLMATEVFDWVSRPQAASETEWVKALRRWVRSEILPRAKAGHGEHHEE